MTIGGWLMMIGSVAGVTVLLIWCVHRVVATPGSTEHLHSQADIHPRDREEP